MCQRALAVPTTLDIGMAIMNTSTAVAIALAVGEAMLVVVIG